MVTRAGHGDEARRCREGQGWGMQGVDTVDVPAAEGSWSPLWCLAGYLWCATLPRGRFWPRGCLLPLHNPGDHLVIGPLCRTLRDHGLPRRRTPVVGLGRRAASAAASFTLKRISATLISSASETCKRSAISARCAAWTWFSRTVIRSSMRILPVKRSHALHSLALMVQHSRPGSQHHRYAWQPACARGPLPWLPPASYGISERAQLTTGFAAGRAGWPRPPTRLAQPRRARGRSP